jgi:hypothetical protein
MSSRKKPAASPKKVKADFEDGARTTAAPQTNIGGTQLPGGFRISKKVTLPSLVMKELGRTYCLHIDNASRVSNVDSGRKDKDGKKEKPADICNVTNVDTGEEFILLLPAVVKANLEQNYEGESYVGRTFAFTNLGKAEGKRYVNFRIDELEQA